MQGIRRILVAASLAACLAGIAAYPISFYRSVSVRRLSPGWIAAARLGGGRASVYCQRYPPTRHDGPAAWAAAVGPVRERFFRANQRWRDALRFDLTTQQWRTSQNAVIVGRTVVVPLWAVIFATALLPSAAAQRWLTRRRRAARGQCLHCGYDLRHAPGRCPECGAAPSPATRPLPMLASA